MEGENMTPQAIRDVVVVYGEELGLSVAPHDLRRTFARLAHMGGAGLDQIQLSLGHASIQTTERYLGVEQDLTDTPCDRLGLRLE
jgi:site-specific recombinase XerD